MIFGLALIIIPPIICGLFFYFLIKTWQEEDEEQTKQAYSAELSDGVYKGKLDANIGLITAHGYNTNTFRFKIRKDELYNIERMDTQEGYFTVEVTKDFSIVLDANRVDKYFEKVVEVPKVVSAER